MARRASRAPGWEHYFPIPRGRSFEVVLERPPLPVRGRGTVVKRTATALHVRVEVGGGFLLPKISADLELTCAADGGGNRGHLEVQVGARSESFDDGDVTIQSHPAKRSREVASSLAPRGRTGSARAVLRATGDGECHLSAPWFEVRLVAKPPSRP